MSKIVDLFKYGYPVWIQKTKISFYNYLIYGHRMDVVESLTVINTILTKFKSHRLDVLYQDVDKESPQTCPKMELLLSELFSFDHTLPFKFEPITTGFIVHPYDGSLYFSSNPNDYYQREFRINLRESEVDIQFYTSRVKMEYSRKMIYFFETNGLDYINSQLRWFNVTKVMI